jgi:hypothetical protein
MHLPSAGCTILLGFLLASWTSEATEPERPSQENFLLRAVFGDGRLWLLSDAGELSTIVPGSKVRERAGLPEPSLDVCASGDIVQTLTCPRDSCKTWTIRRFSEGRWTTSSSIAAEGDSVDAMHCERNGATTILTDHRLIEAAGGKLTSLGLSGKLPIEAVTSIHVTTNDVFVGINAGEWGGGLRRIDRKSGKVSVIEKTSGDMCSGPLNTDCDPVNGIADEPWKAGCIAIAIGLVHFTPHGRIDEICGENVERIYFRPLGAPEQANRKGRDEPFQTEAFFGLIRAGSDLVSVGIDGVYRFGGPGEPVRTPLPEFETIGGIGVSFALPGVVLVLTGINQRRSISGSVPLLVPR